MSVIDLTGTKAGNGMPIPDTTRERSGGLGARISRALDGDRLIALTEHVGDIFVGPEGQLVRVREYLALLADQAAARIAVLRDGRVSTPAPPGGPALITELALTADSTLEALTELRRRLPHQTVPVWVVLEHACLETADPALVAALIEFGLDVALAGRHRLMAVFRTAGPPPSLTMQPGWAVINIPPPDEGERSRVLARTHRREAIPLEPGLSLREVAMLTGGLDTDCLWRLGQEARRGGVLTRDRIVELKTAEINRLSDGTLEVMSGELPEVAGLPNLRLVAEQARLTGTLPSVLMLAGPPGTGKTLSFRWLARWLGLPAVRFGQIRGRYVGDSERFIARARQTLEACAPVAVLRDEADMQDGQDDDGGVSGRIRAEMLDLMNTASRTGIVVVLTTNDPRAGFDARMRDRVRLLPVLHPTVPEATRIAELEAARLGATIDSAAVSDAVRSGLPRVLTGRAVARLVEDAHRFAALASHPTMITEADVRAAWEDTIPVDDAAAHERMALDALLLCGSRSAWPWVAAGRLASPEPASVPPYLEPFLRSDGQLDVELMRRRVVELAGHHG